MSEFETYLIGKKINPVAFKSGEPLLFSNFENHFRQTHPNSFTLQKLFVINQLRRKYHVNNDG